MALVKRPLRAQTLIPSRSLDREIRRQAHENQQREDLERQAGLHDVVAAFSALAGVRRDGRPAAAAGLQEQGDHVAGDEDSGVPEGWDAGVCWAEGRDDAREAEVDACCVESGSWESSVSTARFPKYLNCR